MDEVRTITAAILRDNIASAPGTNSPCHAGAAVVRFPGGGADAAAVRPRRAVMDPKLPNRCSSEIGYAVHRRRAPTGRSQALAEDLETAWLDRKSPQN
jgi:hypothetical protein